MNNLPTWPRQGGSSLLLVLLDLKSDPTELATVSRELEREAANVGVDLGRGLARCADSVRAGVASLRWLDEDSVLVFRCPSDLPIWEAAPLLELGLGTMTAELAAVGVQFLKSCAEIALAHSARIAFIAAHEWKAGDSVRFQSGSLPEFLAFIETPDAWSTLFLGYGNAYVVNSDSESPFWYEVRRNG